MCVCVCVCVCVHNFLKSCETCTNYFGLLLWKFSTTRQALKLMKQRSNGSSDEKSTTVDDMPHHHRRRGRVLRIQLPRRSGGKEGKEEEEEEDEMRELEKRIENAQLPEHALKAAQKELKVKAVFIQWSI